MNTQAVESAALIQQLMAGANLEEVQAELKEVNRKSTRKLPKKKKKVDPEKEAKRDKVRKTGVDIEIDERMKILDRNISFTLAFGGHDIPYKDQLWDVPRRDVTHEIRLCKSFKRASDVAKIMQESELNDAQKDDIRNGIVAYFTINALETVNYSRDILGYGKCYINKDDKIITDIKLVDTYLKDNYVAKGRDKLINDIKNKISNKFMEN